jgi:hypothetical protein
MGPFENADLALYPNFTYSFIILCVSEQGVEENISTKEG